MKKVKLWVAAIAATVLTASACIVATVPPVKSAVAEEGAAALTETIPLETADANYLKMADGTVTLNDWQASAPYNLGGMYYDEYIEVAQDEDLIIEYDFISEGTDGAAFFTLIKGMQKNGQGAVAPDVNSAMEAVHARFTGGYAYTGLGSNFGELMRTFDVNDYDVSPELNAYLAENYLASDAQYYAFPDGTVANQNGWSSGVDFYYLADVKQKSFKDQNCTYRHVFLSEGGYECWQKTIGEADSEYKLILKTADTYAEDWYHSTKSAPDEKIFSHNSGYVGFIMQSMDYKEQVMTIDNFRVTVRGEKDSVAVNDGFDRTTLGKNIQNNWKYVKGGETVFNFDDTIAVTQETLSGAELRLAADEGALRSGIRFTTAVNVQCADFLTGSVVDGSALSVKFGTIITAADLLGGAEFEIAAMDEAGVFYYNVEASGFLPEQSDGKYLYRATLVDIREVNYCREWIARGYVSVTLADGSVQTVYAPFEQSNSRSIYELACAAYADVAAEGDETRLELISGYLDGVVNITSAGEYAGGSLVTGDYAPGYEISAADGVITVTSRKPIGVVLVDGVQVIADISESGGIYTAVISA